MSLDNFSGFVLLHLNPWISNNTDSNTGVVFYLFIYGVFVQNNPEAEDREIACVSHVGFCLRVIVSEKPQNL